MVWFYLLLAGVLEVVWAFYMKQSEGFALWKPTVVTLVTMIASFALLATAMRSLPLGTAYAVWTGIGAVGAFIVGIIVLGESASLPRILSALLLICGIVGLKLTATS